MRHVAQFREPVADAVGRRAGLSYAKSVLQRMAGFACARLCCNHGRRREGVPECLQRLHDYAYNLEFPEDVRVNAAEYLIARGLYGKITDTVN